MTPANLHHQPEPGHLHRLLDALAQLRLDPLDQASRIAVLMTERTLETLWSLIPRAEHPRQPAGEGLRRDPEVAIEGRGIGDALLLQHRDLVRGHGVEGKPAEPSRGELDCTELECATSRTVAATQGHSDLVENSTKG